MELEDTVGLKATKNVSEAKKIYQFSRDYFSFFIFAEAMKFTPKFLLALGLDRYEQKGQAVEVTRIPDRAKITTTG